VIPPTTTIITTRTATVFLLLLEQVEHLLGVHAPILLVVETEALPVLPREGNELLALVHIDQHQVDDIITRHVRQLWVLFVKMFPYSCMAESLV
jgi:hypothetical protein